MGRLLLHTEAVQQLLSSVEGTKPGYGDETLAITPVCVCKSNAGYYVGHWCVEFVDNDTWLPQPYSRDSHYFATPEEAQAYLEY